MQIRSLRRHFTACQHWFLDSAYQITHNQGVKPFSPRNAFLIFFPDYSGPLHSGYRLTGTLENSKNPGEMLHKALFAKNAIFRDRFTSFYRNLMDNSLLIVPICM